MLAAARLRSERISAVDKWNIFQLAKREGTAGFFVFFDNQNTSQAERHAPLSPTVASVGSGRS